MNCPGCGEALASGQDRCPACGSVLGVPSEGALAPDLMRHEPRGRLAEVPAFRKREPSWKDEVRERMRHRRRSRGDDAELPLFAEPAAAPSAPPLVELGTPEPHESPAEFRSFGPASSPEPEPDGPGEIVDLPLRPQQAAAEPDEPLLEAPPDDDAVEAPGGPRLVEWDSAPVADPVAPWTAEDFAAPEAAPAERPVERPAYLGERVQAALLDGATIGFVAALVVYFASRAARVAPLALLPSWPWVAGFLALFSLVYASFFTGLTGQTLGKMALRLRVVDRAGAPPGHMRAALRAALGSLGSLALVGVVPVFFDPARRALHDRLLRTRVIRV